MIEILSWQKSQLFGGASIKGDFLSSLEFRVAVYVHARCIALMSGAKHLISTLRNNIGAEQE